MATLRSHTPANLRDRSSSPTSRMSSGYSAYQIGESRPFLVSGRKERTSVTGFMVLPKESEDAQITGSTRSLDRRLLALNLKGSLMSVRPQTGLNGSKLA